MNKTITALILGVILLAMGLIMFSQYTQKPESATATPPAVTAQTPPIPQGMALNSPSRAPLPSAAPKTPESAVQKAPRPTQPKTTGAQELQRPPQPPAMASASPKAQTPATIAPEEDKQRPPQPSAMPDTTAPAAAKKEERAPAPALDAQAPPKAAEAVPAEQLPPPVQPSAAGKSSSPTTSASAAQPPKAPTADSAATTPKTSAADAAASQAPKAPPKTTPPTIEKIVVRKHPEGTNILIALSEQANYKSSRLTNPERLVIDFAGVWEVKAPGVPENEFVSNVRIGKYAKATRIVLDLRTAPASVKYYKADGNDLEVRLR